MKTKLLPTAHYEVAEVELVYKSKIDIHKRPKIIGAAKAYELFMGQWDDNKIELQEQFKVMLLNRANHVLGIYESSTGGTLATIADVSLVFAAALKARASAIIVAHNHPCGDATPSENDRVQTRNLVEAGNLFSIIVLDHIIITKHCYYSFAGNNLM